MAFPRRYAQIHVNATNGYGVAQNCHWFRVDGPAIFGWWGNTYSGIPDLTNDVWQDVLDQWCVQAYALWPYPLAGAEFPLWKNQAWMWLFDEDFFSGDAKCSLRACTAPLGGSGVSSGADYSLALPGACAVVIRRFSREAGRSGMGRIFHGGLSKIWIKDGRITDAGRLAFFGLKEAMVRSWTVNVVDPLGGPNYDLTLTPCVCSYATSKLIPITDVRINDKIGARRKYCREGGPALEWYWADHRYPR